MEPNRSSQMQSLVIAIHEHLVRKNHFDAHYLIDSMTTLGSAMTAQDDVPPSFWHRVNDIMVNLFIGAPASESGFTFVRALSKLKILEHAQLSLRPGFDAMGQHFLESTYTGHESSEFIRMANTLIGDDTKAFVKPRVVHLLAMAKYLEPRSDCYTLDVSVLRERIKTNNRFIEDIGSIINPLLQRFSEAPQDPRNLLVAEKLAEPLYALIKELASAPGIAKINLFLTNLSWLCITRSEVGEFTLEHPVSLCNPKSLGELCAALLQDQYPAIHKSVSDPLSDISDTYSKAAQLVDLMRAHVEPAQRRDAMTTLFCALLASHHYYVGSSHSHEAEQVTSFLQDVYPEIDLQRAESTMKRRHSMKLTLYIKNQHRNDLGKLSSRSRDNLFGHDLGL